jgi:hypothetical protein
MSFTLKQLKSNRVKVEKCLPEAECSYVGGKINSKTLHKMIKNGYADDPKETENLDDYVLDKELSGTRTQVYNQSYNKSSKGVHDVMTDIGLMFGHKSGK